MPLASQLADLNVTVSVRRWVFPKLGAPALAGLKGKPQGQPAVFRVPPNLATSTFSEPFFVYICIYTYVYIYIYIYIRSAYIYIYVYIFWGGLCLGFQEDHEDHVSKLKVLEPACALEFQRANKREACLVAVGRRFWEWTQVPVVPFLSGTLSRHGSLTTLDRPVRQPKISELCAGFGWVLDRRGQERDTPNQQGEANTLSGCDSRVKLAFFSFC